MSLNKDSNFISAVVYGGKNVDMTIAFLRELDECFSSAFSKFEFVVVNDHYYSPEEQSQIQQLKFGGNKQLNIINMSFHQGLEKAMNAGIDFAIGDYVFEFDSVDRDYEWNEVLEVYAKCLSGSDIVSATSGRNRRFASKLFYRVFNRYSTNQYRISSNSFFLLSRRAINRIDSISLSIPYRKAIYSNCGLQFSQYEYSPIKKKIKDESKSDKRAVIMDSLVLYTNVFFRIALAFALIMIVLSAAVLTYTLVVFFAQNPVEGWTTTMLLLSVGFAAVFVFMCILLVYLKIIINLNFQKQKYLVESIKKGNKE